MVRHVMWITFILAVQLSSVFGRNNFYEHYYSRYHHKSHSTTTALSSSSTTEISTEVKPESSVSGDDSLESAEHFSTVDVEPTRHRNKTVHSYGYNDFNDDVNPDFAARVGIIVACSFVFIVGSCCLFCCVRICCRRNAVRRGFIIADRNQGAAPAVGPLQPTVGQLLPPIASPYPPQYQEERTHLFPPQYQPQAMQQQYSPVQPAYQAEYSPTTPQNHNPPEAPPPYEFPEKF